MHPCGTEVVLWREDTSRLVKVSTTSLILLLFQSLIQIHIMQPRDRGTLRTSHLLSSVVSSAYKERRDGKEQLNRISQTVSQ